MQICQVRPPSVIKESVTNVGRTNQCQSYVRYHVDRLYSWPNRTIRLFQVVSTLLSSCDNFGDVHPILWVSLMRYRVWLDLFGRGERRCRDRVGEEWRYLMLGMYGLKKDGVYTIEREKEGHTDIRCVAAAWDYEIWLVAGKSKTYLYSHPASIKSISPFSIIWLLVV